jgi:hydroxyacylglutathione hydrolase
MAYYIVLTHSHYDHAENAAVVKENYGAKIIIQRLETQNLTQGNSPIPNGTSFITKILVGLGRKINRFDTYQKTHPDIKVDEELFLSPKCYLIHTPGHTKGSISLVADDEIALVGDAMFGVFKWSVFPPFADEVPIMIRSWEKLLNTNCKVFLPGHGSENSRELLKRQFNKYKGKYAH